MSETHGEQSPDVLLGLLFYLHSTDTVLEVWQRAHSPAQQKYGRSGSSSARRPTGYTQGSLGLRPFRSMVVGRTHAVNLRSVFFLAVDQEQLSVSRRGVSPLPIT